MSSKLVQSDEFRVQGKKTHNHEPITHYQLGFTLVELMVTISIVAILTTIGVAAYRSVLKDGRNAKRQADLRVIQSALEQYNNDQRNYPVAITFGNSLTFGGRTYLNLIPTDPLNTGQYTYCYKALGSADTCAGTPATVCNNTTTTCVSYCLYAKLENSTPNLTDSCSGAATRNFRVTPP